MRHDLQVVLIADIIEVTREKFGSQIHWLFQKNPVSWKPIPYFVGQWLNFKLFGITYFVEKIKFKLLFRNHWLSE